MPLDLRKMSFQQAHDGEAAPTMDSLVDTLADPLEAHGMGGMDRVREAASGVLGSGVREKLGMSDVGSRRAEKTKSILDEIGEMGSEVRVAYLRKHFRAEMLEFMQSELSDENLLCLEAIDSGMPKTAFNATFVESGSPKEINVSFQLRRTLLSDQGSPFDARREMLRVISGDVWRRMAISSSFKAAIARKL